jgi:hypothetical protein
VLILPVALGVTRAGKAPKLPCMVTLGVHHSTLPYLNRYSGQADHFAERPVCFLRGPTIGHGHTF